MVSAPVLLSQRKLHTGTEETLVVHSVCQHCCLHEGVQSQAEHQLSDAALHQLIHLRTGMPGYTAQPPCLTSCVRL